LIGEYILVEIPDTARLRQSRKLLPVCSGVMSAQHGGQVNINHFSARPGTPRGTAPPTTLATDSRTLPPGWTLVLSKSKNQEYFFNAVSGQCTWESPSTHAVDDLWSEFWSQSKQRYYFFNSNSGSCRWDLEENESGFLSDLTLPDGGTVPVSSVGAPQNLGRPMTPRGAPGDQLVLASAERRVPNAFEIEATIKSLEQQMAFDNALNPSRASSAASVSAARHRPMTPRGTAQAARGQQQVIPSANPPESSLGSNTMYLFTKDIALQRSSQARNGGSIGLCFSRETPPVCIRTNRRIDKHTNKLKCNIHTYCIY